MVLRHEWSHVAHLQSGSIACTDKDFCESTKGRPFLISLVELLEAVPGTLFLKNLHPDRHLAIPVELLESVPGTDGSDISS